MQGEMRLGNIYAAGRFQFVKPRRKAAWREDIDDDRGVSGSRAVVPDSESLHTKRKTVVVGVFVCRGF
jgi:hypothetical protein